MMLPGVMPPDSCGTCSGPCCTLCTLCTLCTTGGGGGIRTLEDREALPVFKTGALSRTPPPLRAQMYAGGHPEAAEQEYSPQGHVPQPSFFSSKIRAASSTAKVGQRVGLPPRVAFTWASGSPT